MTINKIYLVKDFHKIINKINIPQKKLKKNKINKINKFQIKNKYVIYLIKDNKLNKN